MQNVVRIRREPEGMTESSAQAAQAAPAGGPVITARDLVFRYPPPMAATRRSTADARFLRGAITVIVAPAAAARQRFST